MKKDVWMKEASCLNLDTNMFFDKYEEDLDIRHVVDTLCKKCPARRQCLTSGVSRQEWGTWGGIYLEKGKISKEFNSHKTKTAWFDVWSALTMES